MESWRAVVVGTVVVVVVDNGLCCAIGFMGEIFNMSPLRALSRNESSLPHAMFAGTCHYLHITVLDINIHIQTDAELCQTRCNTKTVCK